MVKNTFRLCTRSRPLGTVTIMSPDDSQTSFLEAPKRVAVALPLPLDVPTYDYAVPEGWALPERGTLVDVPLGGRTVRGVVWGEASSDDFDPKKLKPLAALVELPQLPGDLCDLIDWIAGYTLNPLGLVLRLATAVPQRWQPPRPLIVFQRTGHLPDKMTAARKRVLDAMEDMPPLSQADIVERAGVSASVVKGLVEQGALQRLEMVGTPHLRQPDLSIEGPVLNDQQDKAASQLRQAVRDGFSVSLLEGVTGSGKTETYFEAVVEALAQNKQVLILLPEIALTAQFFDRFEKRFGAPPTEWHSDLSPTQRRDNWQAVASGDAKVIVGARSSLFLPFPDLGLIVVDEEHDAAFKQEDHARYHARDMAIVRGRLSNHAVILASATPSLETVVNAQAGRYKHVKLTSRYEAASLPQIATLDMRRHAPDKDRFLSHSLLARVAETVAEGNQAMIFLNRRGYAPLTLCRACGHRMKCPSCDAWLVEHRFRNRLQCHHCGYREPLPNECPACGAEGKMVALGPGVERIYEELSQHIPEARTVILSSDFLVRDQMALKMQGGKNVPSVRQLAHQRIRDFAEGRADVMIGTQIIAKGHHFPNLTLVGVVDADLGLAGGDLRAAERTFQMMTQVAGRAGRHADKPGRVLLQTYDPHHPVIEALVSGDVQQFRKIELSERKLLGMPPFGRLVSLILSGPDEDRVRQAAGIVSRSAPQMDGFTVLGPAPAPVALIRGRHRMRFLIKARLDVKVQPVLANWLGALKLPPNVRLDVDVDPQSFM